MIRMISLAFTLATLGVIGWFYRLAKAMCWHDLYIPLGIFAFFALMKAYRLLNPPRMRAAAHGCCGCHGRRG